MADKEQIGQALKQALQALYGERLAGLVLYGSYARNEARPDSDMDFLVVLKDEQVRVGHELRFMGPSLAALDLRFGLRISTYPTALPTYLHSPLHFYKNVRTEGIAV